VENFLYTLLCVYDYYLFNHRPRHLQSAFSPANFSLRQQFRLLHLQLCVYLLKKLRIKLEKLFVVHDLNGRRWDVTVCSEGKLPRVDRKTEED
jgi:hypothetical protein